MVYVRTKNMKKRRSVPEIAINTSNTTVGFYFVSLYTGNRMHIYNWDELHIDHEVIIRVEDLSTDEYHTTIENRHLIFEWSLGREISDEAFLFLTTIKS